MLNQRTMGMALIHATTNSHATRSFWGEEEIDLESTYMTAEETRKKFVLIRKSSRLSAG